MKSFSDVHSFAPPASTHVDSFLASARAFDSNASDPLQPRDGHLGSLKFRTRRFGETSGSICLTAAVGGVFFWLEGELG